VNPLAGGGFASRASIGDVAQGPLTPSERRRDRREAERKGRKGTRLFELDLRNVERIEDVPVTIKRFSDGKTDRKTLGKLWDRHFLAPSSTNQSVRDRLDESVGDLRSKGVLEIRSGQVYSAWR